MSPSPVVQLEEEWERVSAPAVRVRLRAWCKSEPSLTPFPDGRALLAFLHGPAQPADKDGALRSLLIIARADDLAGRVVLQALLPGLKALARRLASLPGTRDELWQLVLAAAWGQIVSYPLARRPARIAANLLLDTLRAALAESERERSLHAELTEAVLAAPAPPASGTVDALIADAVERGVLSAPDAELVLETRVDGVELAAAAARRGISYNTAKLRRQRGERRLLLFLGLPDVPRGRQRRRSFPASEHKRVRATTPATSRATVAR